MQTWYNRKAGDAIDITDDIGAYGVSAKAFLDEMHAIEGDTINLSINSPGGDVFAGLAIYNALRYSGKTINVKVLGIAASAASLVAMAGDEIEMPENAMMMIHNPWSFALGDAQELRESADVLDKIGDSLAGTYAKRTGKGLDEIKAMLHAETWMTANEALEMGFATKVTPAFTARASFALDRLPDAARAVYALAQTPAPQPADAPPADEEPQPTHAEQVAVLASAWGLDAYAARWALDPAIPDLAAVQNKMQAAREIKALCGMAKLDHMADGLIRSGQTVPQASAAILAALEDAQEHIDTHPKAFDQRHAGAQPSGVRTEDIWAARRQNLKGA